MANNTEIDLAFEFDAPTGGDIFNQEGPADDWFDNRRSSITSDKPVLEPTDLTIGEEDDDAGFEDATTKLADPCDAAFEAQHDPCDVAFEEQHDPCDAAFEEQQAADEEKENTTPEEEGMADPFGVFATTEATSEDATKRSSIHQRYLEEKEEVLRTLKEKQARTLAEAAERAALEHAEAQAAAARQAEAEKAAAEAAAMEKQAADEAAAKAKAEEEAAAAKAAEEKAAADKMTADKAAIEKAARARVEAKKALEAKAAAELKQAAEAKAAVEAKKAAMEARKKAAAEAKKAADAQNRAQLAARAKERAEAKKNSESTPSKATPSKATPSKAKFAVFRSVDEHSGRDSISSQDSDMSDASQGNKRDRVQNTPGTANKRKSKRIKPSSVTPFKLTVPNSPKFSTGSRRRPTEDVQTTEDKEMEDIRAKQAKLRKQREARKKSGKKAVAQPAVGTQKSAKPLTETKEFNFRSDQRAAAAQEDCQELKMFGKFTSMAECVASFEAKTPKRFRTKSRTKPTTPCEKMDASRLTTPQSPAFASDKRMRAAGANYKTREEQEIEMMEEFKKNPFKAQPINKAVMEASSGGFGVSAVEKKPLTQAMSPKLLSDMRAECKKHTTPAPDSPRQFKATKLNPAVLAGPKMVPKLDMKKITVAKSPELLSAKRATLRPVEVPEEETFSFKAQPIPNAVLKGPKAVQYEAKELTQPMPFQLASDARHEQAQAEFNRMKAEKEAQEAEAHNFKANPIQFFESATPRGTPRTATVTEPTPFNLASEKLHHAKKKEWERQLEEELEQERAQFSSFRAKPAEVLVKSPFVAKKSNKPLTEISNFTLASESRSSQREQFDSVVANKQREADRVKVEEAERQAQQEAEEIKEMRRTKMCFKATPIMNFDQPFRATPANKELTMPMSPALQTKARGGMRAQ